MMRPADALRRWSRSLPWIAASGAFALCAPTAAPAQQQPKAPREDESSKVESRLARPADSSTRESGRETGSEKRGYRDVDDASSKRSPVHPQHEDAMEEAREDVELLEVQVETQQARARLADARVKQAQGEVDELKKNPADQGKLKLAENDLAVLKAEAELARSEAREPVILLKRARTRLQDLEGIGERLSRSSGSSNTRQMGYMGMNHPGMHPMAMGHMGMMGHPGMMRLMEREMEIDAKLDHLLESIEVLETDLEALKGARGSSARDAK